jgi:hypothetical protein
VVVSWSGAEIKVAGSWSGGQLGAGVGCRSWSGAEIRVLRQNKKLEFGCRLQLRLGPKQPKQLRKSNGNSILKKSLAHLVQAEETWDR